MSNVCKKWYQEYKKRHDENIKLLNEENGEDKASRAITGLPRSQCVWRYLEIHGAVERMGGFANFSHYVNKCAETDYEVFSQLEKENKSLKYKNRGLEMKLGKIARSNQKEDPQEGTELFREMFWENVKSDLIEIADPALQENLKTLFMTIFDLGYQAGRADMQNSINIGKNLTDLLFNGGKGEERMES